MTNQLWMPLPQSEDLLGTEKCQNCDDEKPCRLFSFLTDGTHK